MDIISLKYVLTLAEMRNYSAAAHECAISQSALTKHIQKIETEIGGGTPIEIFDRNTRPISLTTAGKEFVLYARQMVDHYDKMLISMRKYLDDEETTLILGAIPVLKHLGVVPVLNEFRKNYKGDFAYDIVDRPTRELMRMLSAGELDAAIVISEKETKTNASLRCYDLRENEMVAVVNKMHPLAAFDEVSLEDISKHTLVLLDEETAMYSVCMNAFNENGIFPTRVKTRRNVDTIFDKIEYGMVVGMFSNQIAQARASEDLKILKIKEPVGYTISLVAQNRRNTNTLLNNFIKFLLEWKF